MGSSSQERFWGIATTDVSGLVAGVGSGVTSAVPGGVGERLTAGVEPSGGYSRSTEEAEVFNAMVALG